MLNTTLLIIDPQNDFMDAGGADLPLVGDTRLAPALPVPGAMSDMARLSQFIEATGEWLSDIVVTLDSHPYVAIERTPFWRDQNGREVAPFTTITAEAVRAGTYSPMHSPEIVLRQLEQLEAQGQALMVWPVHCVTGTWGHNIQALLMDRLNQWECQTGKPVRKVAKGEYPFSEHFGVFEAEVPLDHVPSTQFNTSLARTLVEDTDVLLVAGEAASHCVAASVEQLIQSMNTKGREVLHYKDKLRIILLMDCMSPVTGFESAANDFFARAEAAGVERMTTQEVLAQGWI